MSTESHISKHLLTKSIIAVTRFLGGGKELSYPEYEDNRPDDWHELLMRIADSIEQAIQDIIDTIKDHINAIYDEYFRSIFG